MKRSPAWQMVLAILVGLVLFTVAGIALAPIPAAAEPFAYVANQGANTVSVIDTATNMVVETIGMVSRPSGVAITPDGAFAYVTNFSSHTVSVIATATNTVVATIAVGINPRAVAITPDGAFAYVPDFSFNTVSVIRTADNTVVATVAVGGGPWGIAITPLRTTYACTGFAPPFDQLISLLKDRAIPLKMQLFEDGVLIDDLNIAGAPPVVNIAFSAGVVVGQDVTNQLEPLGQANEGNQFRFDVGASQWVFNLGTKPFTAPGTYTVKVAAGDSYGVSPTCTGRFVRPE